MAVIVEFSTIAEMFESICAKFSGSPRPVLMHKREGRYVNVTHAELREHVRAIALGLAAIGVRRGDRVGLISENRPEWPAVDLAIVTLGAVSVPLYPTLPPKQIEEIFRDAGVRAVVVSNQMQFNKIRKIACSLPSMGAVVVMADNVAADDEGVVSLAAIKRRGEEFHRSHPGYVEAEMSRVRPEDLLTLIYTSGTTGTPKGVMLTHANLVSNMKASASCIPFAPEDVLLSFLPLCHSYERMAGYYTAMACGVLIAYAESVETVRENMVEVRPTVVTTVPRLFERMHARIGRQLRESSPFRRRIFQWAIDVGSKRARTRHGRSASVLLRLQHAAADALVLRKIRAAVGGRIRFFVSGGAALPAELGEFFDAAGIRILEGYGLTESSPVICVNRVDEYRFGSVGKPIPGVEVAIAPDGEILARGPNIMKGYWNKPVDTAEAVDPKGWLHTGDVGAFDGDGFLRITDRKKHLFVSTGGKNIAPQPIETLFKQSTFIDQFVLIGEKRTCCTALIVPEFEALAEYALSNGIAFGTHADLVARPEIVSMMQNEVSRLQKDLATFERVRRFTLLSEPLTLENGEITPTLKVRRKAVEEKFRDVIARMYEGIE